MACTLGRILTGILLLFAATSLAYGLIEDKGPVESPWWALVTASTVGYGDFYPQTTAGRGVAAVLMVFMALLLILLNARVTASLIPNPDRYSHAEQMLDEARAEIAHSYLLRIMAQLELEPDADAEHRILELRRAVEAERAA